MKTKIFSFNLPRELIAQYPLKERGASRLLVADRKTGRIDHAAFESFPSLFSKGDVVVFNNTSVLKSRLFGTTAEGKQVEVLLLTRLGPLQWEVLVKGKRKKLEDKRLIFPEARLGVLDFTKKGPTLCTDSPIDNAYLERNGHVPLPPYIRRKDETADAHRYETVYAKEKGSAAAPTAGLHFTVSVIDALKEAGVTCCYITLHVGLGTFLPIKSEDIEDHVMHEERYEISEETADTINAAKAKGGKICAIGTTSVRTLESAWKDGRLQAGKGATNLFITPGYKFKAVDCLLTNFHTPESTLLVLVSTFAGIPLTKKAYEEAVRIEYRFFSYGDAMFIR